jgi:ABC-type multidrug transport system fused ATPase/permease subunit
MKLSDQEPFKLDGAVRPKHLDVEMPRFKGLGWVLGLVKLTWVPLSLAVVGRWSSSILQILVSSLIGFLVVQLGNSDQSGIVLPQALLEWLKMAESPALTALFLTLAITAASSLIDMLVAWTRVWVHLIINKRVTAQIITTSINTNYDVMLDASTAVQRWLLKLDLVYFLHESIAATIGHVGTVVIALIATYNANHVAGNVSVVCLILWLVTCVPLTLKALRASQISAVAHESVGRIIRDGIALRSDLSRPSLKTFWVRRSLPDLAILQRSISTQGMWNTFLEGAMSAIARLMPIVAVLAAIQTGSIGSAIAILLYLTRMAGPLGGLAGILPWIQQNLISIQRMYNMIIGPDSPSSETSSPYQVKHELVITDWSVRVGTTRLIQYPDLRASNEYILCIVGPSGSGKSTLMKSLAGQLRIESGTLILDGERIDQSSSFWQESCSLVPQEPELLPGTVEDNLKGFPNWTSTELRIAAISKVLANTDDGLGSIVGIDDKGVSVGQRRGIAVLRSVGADSAILFLDEPLAGVDDSIVSILKEVFEEARREGRILILSAHEHDFNRLGLPATKVIRLHRVFED